MTNNLQLFEWGHIKWIYEPKYNDSLNVMHIGIATILPGKRHNRHIHYGDEQFLYILSGRAQQFIDNSVSVSVPGSFYHIEAGSVHETINGEDEPLVQLAISIPVQYENKFLGQNKIKSLLERKNKKEISFSLDDQIKDIVNEIISSLKMPISVIDAKGNIIIEGKNYPEFCIENCSIDIDIQNCSLNQIEDDGYYSDPTTFICPFGLTVFNSSIVNNTEIIGTIKGGYIRTVYQNTIGQNNSLFDSIPIVPKATIKGIIKQIIQLNRNIINYYTFENTELELSKKQEIIQDISKHEIVLEELLKSTQEKVISIQLNNHFLYNTLNALAHMAINENADKTYEAIIELAKMLRYTFKNNVNFTTIKDEISHLTNYINLQKLRFGPRLKVELESSTEIENVIIPFNFLQPIIENCFVHGFKNKKSNMVINLVVKQNINNVIIEITDNGLGIRKRHLQELVEKITENTEIKSGLGMIYSKLQLFYNQRFDFNIFSLENRGTTIRIVLPNKFM